MELKVLKCNVCGNMVTFLRESGAPMSCCGQNMNVVVPGTVDASLEKHVPVYKVEGNIVTVTVGAVKHPMLPEHYIQWIAIQTKNGIQIKELKPGEKPEACFALCCGDEVVAVYEYCNLHSLWKA